MSKLAPPLPTQCFFDVVVVPLPTWVYLLSIAVLFGVTTWRRRRNGGMGAISRSVSKGGVPPAWSAGWRRRVLHGAYYFALGVLALMEAVEVWQLTRAGLGRGLLPGVFAGLAAAAALQATDGAAGRVGGAWYWAPAAVLWAAGLVVTVLKTAALVAGLGLAGPLAREDDPYPTVHQLTDLVILAVFYALAAALEVAVALVRRRARAAQATGDDVVELRSEFDWKD